MNDDYTVPPIFLTNARDVPELLVDRCRCCEHVRPRRVWIVAAPPITRAVYMTERAAVRRFDALLRKGKTPTITIAELHPVGGAA